MSKVETFEVESFQWDTISEIQEQLELESEVPTSEEHLSSQARESWLGEAIREQLDRLQEELERAEQALQTTASDEACRALDRLQRARCLERAASQQALFEEVLREELDGSSEEVLQRAENTLKQEDAEGLAHMESQLDETLSSLEDATQRAHERLARAEQDALTRTTQDVLERCGYEVRHKHQGRGDLVRGKKEDLSVAAHLEGGEVEMDLAGFEGRSCEEEMERLKEAFRERGISLRLTKSDFHGQEEGGPLAQEASEELLFNPLRDQSSTDETPSDSEETSSSRRNIQRAHQRQSRRRR
jgi:hypothetical protein